MKANLRKTKLMVSGREGEVKRSNTYLCVGCGRRVMTNSDLCMNCGKLTHVRCAKMKRITQSLVRHFFCAQCVKIRKGRMEPIKE